MGYSCGICYFLFAALSLYGPQEPLNHTFEDDVDGGDDDDREGADVRRQAGDLRQQRR